MIIEPELTAALSNHAYSIERGLGSGGTSTVYLVNSTRYPDRQFAIKQLDLVDSASSMRREMTVLCNLDHPNVIKLYEFFEDSKYFYFVLEYCPGGSLMDRLILHGRVQSEHLMPFCSQIIAGLAYCHSQGVSHGDIKPQNILIDTYNRCKLVDFGLSQHFESDNISTMFLGSPLFMAPEVLQKQRFDPFIADIWSLGITFYWMALGRGPWPDLKTTIQSAQCGLPPMPTVLPIDFRSLVKAMVEHDPSKRITMHEILVHPALQQIQAAEAPGMRGKFGMPTKFVATPMIPKSRSMAISMLLPPLTSRSIARRGRSSSSALPDQLPGE
jgi:serine/threonine protein kinase